MVINILQQNVLAGHVNSTQLLEARLYKHLHFAVTNISISTRRIEYAHVLARCSSNLRNTFCSIGTNEPEFLFALL